MEGEKIQIKGYPFKAVRVGDVVVFEPDDDRYVIGKLNLPEELIQIKSKRNKEYIWTSIGVFDYIIPKIEEIMNWKKVIEG